MTLEWTDWLAALVLSVIQGFTEFIPVSSSGHLVAIPWAFGLDSPLLNGLTFIVAVHVGTGLAAISAMSARWRQLLSDARSGGRESRSPARRKLGAIILGTLAVGLVGLVLESVVESSLRQPRVVALALIGGGIVLYAADRLGRLSDGGGRSVLVWLAIAISQIAAFIPGISRSGITISVGRTLGVGRVESTEYSFLLMAPVIMGAAVLRGYRLVQEGATLEAWALLGAAALVSGVAGLVAARWLLGFVEGRGFLVFALYRVAAGAAVLALLAARG